MTQVTRMLGRRIAGNSAESDVCVARVYCVCTTESELNSTVGLYSQVMRRYNLSILATLSALDLNRLLPTETLAPDAAANANYPARRDGQAAAPFYWCMSQMCLLNFLHWWHAREGYQSVTYDHHRLMLQDRDDVSSDRPPNILRSFLRAMNQGLDYELADFYKQYSYLLEFIMAGGWMWASDLHDPALEGSDSLPQPSPDRSLARPAEGSPALAASAAALTSDEQARQLADAIYRVRRVQRRDRELATFRAEAAASGEPPLRVPPTHLAPPAQYTAQESSFNQDYWEDWDDKYWKDHRDIVQESFSSSAVKVITPTDIQTGEYAEINYRPRVQQPFIYGSTNRVFVEMQQFVRSQLGNQDRNQMTRVLLLHGNPGEGKTFLATQSVRCALLTRSQGRVHATP